MNTKVEGDPMPEAVARYFSCINAEDWDGLREVFCENAELVAVGTRPRRGRDDVLGYYPRALASWPTHLDTPTRCLVSGTTATVEIRFDGAAADGTPITFEAVDVFDLDRPDGRIARLSTWYDVAAVRRLLPRQVPPVIAEYFRIMDAEDWDSLPSVFAPDARVVPVGARPRQGLDDIRNFYAKALAPYEHHHDEPTRVLVDGDVVTVEIAFEGMLRDGRRITFDAVDVIDLSDGRIVRLTNWYDVAAVRAQLG